MRKLSYIIILTVASCNHPGQGKVSGDSKMVQINECDYNLDYEHCGNRVMDTITVNDRFGKRIVDPIDDFTNFQETEFGFVKTDEKLYKKARHHRRCGEKKIDVEFYQDFSDRIDLQTYREYDETYFTTNEKVYFWWVNSGGHLIIPINDADPNTFEPLENICGGIDKSGIYYGCPNHGVYKLNIPFNSTYEFIAKENNYWNSPNHFVIIDDKVYDIVFELKKGYYCKLNKKVDVNEL